MKILSDGVTTITVSYGDLSSSDIIAINKVQDYTSFVFVNMTGVDMTNVVVGYKLANETYKKLTELGNLNKGVSSKDVKMTDDSISEIYFFSDYNGIIRVNKVFKLTNNMKNIIQLPSGLSGVSASPKSDPTKYPQ